MITSPQRQRKQRRFVTYDLEWAQGEWYEDRKGMVQYPLLQLAGVYDGQKYRAYRTIHSFIEGELTRKNSGVWFYAHAGGLADAVFLLEYLVDSEYTVEASFSGSSAIIIHIMEGRYKWTFVDSYWLLRDKLANLAKFVGMEKSSIDFETDNMLELMEYNRLDCEILYVAIIEFEKALWELGGQLEITLASSAMALFKRQYLKGDIQTSISHNDILRQAYSASRVEVIKKECENAFYYDVNSSFPYAMTFAVPGTYQGRVSSGDRYLRDDSSSLVFIDATISVPEMHLPPLPFRYDTSLYFPIGEWRAWFTGPDLGLLLDKGGQIVEVHETMAYEPRTDLRDYALDLYDKRLKAKKAGSTMEVVVYKLLLNSLYGKFGESRTKSGLLLNPEYTPHPEDEHSEGLELLFPGAYIKEEEVEVAHEHVPIAAWITSIARRTLYREMDAAGDCYYCDTDGFATTNPDVETGDALGELKLETVIKNGYFHRPKVYYLETEDEKKVRAKGFTLGPDYKETLGMESKEKEAFIKKVSVEKFMGLLEGKDIEMKRFSRIRELFRDGLVVPTERIIKKGFRDNRREKRRLLDDGISTVPWSVKELLGDDENGT